jgi:putative heme degradation protein
MKQATAFFMVLALATSAVQAQDKKQQATVAADKADLKRNWEAREYDKNQFDTYGLKADRKVHRKQEIKLLKDQLKKDVKVVKKAI